MEREWTGNARRLSEADRAEIERRIHDGEAFATIATAVGCSTKSIQRYLVLTGGDQATKTTALGAAAVVEGAGRDLAGAERRRIVAVDREAFGSSCIDDLARGGLEQVA